MDHALLQGDASDVVEAWKSLALANGLKELARGAQKPRQPRWTLALALGSVLCLAIGGRAAASAYPALLAFWMPILLLALSGPIAVIVNAARDLSDRRLDVTAEMEHMQTWIQVGRPAHAIELARSALGRCRGQTARARLWEVMARAAIRNGDPVLAHSALGHMPRGALSPLLVAGYLRTCNRLEEAVGLLVDIRSAGLRSPETTKLLVDLLLQRGEPARARELARADAALLTPDEHEAVENSVPDFFTKS